MLTLQRELKTYERELPEMLRENDGAFAVIKGESVRNVLPTYEDALNWAYEQYGLEHFMVKQIDAEAAVAHFSRDLGSCAT